MLGLTGRSRALSPFRRIVGDLMHFSSKVPTVILERRMRLGPLVARRRLCASRPCWTSIFMKAYGIVAARHPMLRQSYLGFPFPRIYEHPTSVGIFNIERIVHGEKIVVMNHVESPERQGLMELDAYIESLCARPVEEMPAYRNAMRLARVPRPFRRWAWWFGLNFFGDERAKHFGTFGTTTTAQHGAGVLKLVPLLTTTYHYGLFDDEGSIDVRLAFDHRVIDGAPAAEILAELEEVLLGEVLEEVAHLAATSGRSSEAARETISMAPITQAALKRTAV